MCLGLNGNRDWGYKDPNSGEFEGIECVFVRKKGDGCL